MSAHIPTRPHPAPRGGVDIRLPWWAFALPTLAFFVLLALILNPTDAHAAAGDPAIAQLLERVQQLISR
ncbi:hypothetical protein [Streptomyces sp. NL15-2K]|uniref:hypothetical protein n=1 Tax=Streptomyces sp. NL15-2K TaxID=376149 RepID=UPI000F588C7A|nr:MULTISPECIES: hypothetical protein [Actinomycetes]WKX07996.1 hypothetical protein Q4V64_11150 [Kutzneria buriramensis]GCB50547.1 hypothetical protein SNL152K_7891 [Streptomyces sp. NL15-2K]